MASRAADNPLSCSSDQQPPLTVPPSTTYAYEPAPMARTPPVATGIPGLLGHIYVGPYLALEPDLAFVLDDGAPAGYVLGARTPEISIAAANASGGRHSERYANPDEPAMDARRAPAAHDPPPATARRCLLMEYPAHLHIDLLPRRRGQERPPADHAPARSATDPRLIGSAPGHRDGQPPGHRLLPACRHADASDTSGAVVMGMRMHA